MDHEHLPNFLSHQGLSAKQVPIMNHLSMLGHDGGNSLELTTNFSDRFLNTKFFTCPHCAKMFNSQITLNNHVKNEHYPSFASNFFSLNSQHSMTVSHNVEEANIKKENPNFVVIKDDPDAGYEKKVKHRRIETKPRKPYEKKFNGSNIHIDINGPFTCKNCNEDFNECCKFSMHMNNVHLKRRRLTVRCQICEKKFVEKGYGDHVMEQHHLPYQCDMCDKTFYFEANLEHHRKKDHIIIKPYKCSLCIKSFSQATGLSQHMKSHSGIKPYICSVCTKAFRQKAGLDQHLRIHSNEKPYSCLICDRAFTQSAHLGQHMRIHTKIEPYECNMCGKRFKQASHLNFHMKAHEKSGDLQ